MYEELKGFLEQTDIKDQFEMEFIDINKDDLSSYGEAGEIATRGYQLPLTFIAGDPIFSGKVDNYKAYLTLKKLL